MAVAPKNFLRFVFFIAKYNTLLPSGLMSPGQQTSLNLTAAPRGILIFRVQSADNSTAGYLKYLSNKRRLGAAQQDRTAFERWPLGALGMDAEG
jgi:hypothetical protein